MASASVLTVFGQNQATSVVGPAARLLHVPVVRNPVPPYACRDEPHRAKHGEGELVVNGEAVIAVDGVGKQ